MWGLTYLIIYIRCTTNKINRYNIWII
jgi:hypothetical protein